MASLAGTTIDKYDMIEEVGCGGMAVVYRGRDRVLEREVAVKVLHPHLADREESRARLRREAIAVAKLRHENILEIFDYSGPEAAESYIVTEFIHGPTLKEWMDDGMRPRPAVAAMVVHRLCAALTHAHRSSIVHRDIKPENVMIRKADGVLKLMDFGIAQIIDNQKLTLTGQLIGSPAYMAPELISGRPLDARTDLFSLGILLYQLTCGALPFSGRNPHEVLTRIAEGEYPPPSSLCPLVDRDLEAIIDKTLATNPDDRYQSVETLAHDLEAYLAEMNLEPTASELKHYFAEPDEYVRELDVRVSTALMLRAEEAAAEGSTARSIRLLGRVLEIDAEHHGARAMLRRLRARERRVRHLMVGAGGVALAGLVTAGVMLLDPGRRDRAEGQQAGLSPPPALADEAPREDPPLIPAVEPASEQTSARPADSDALPTDTGPASIAPAGLGEDDREGPRVRPLKPKGKTSTPDAAVVTTNCTIVLEGIPVSTAKGLTLKVDGERFPADGKEVEVRFTGEGAKVEVGGTRYSGTTHITTEECADGTTTLTLKPRPGLLTFQLVPDKTEIVCSEGCPAEMLGASYLPQNFPQIPITDGVEQLIVLTFKHPDYYDVEKKLRVHPGPQTVNPKLKQRSTDGNK